MSGNADQIAYWSGPRTRDWLLLQEETDRAFAGLTAALLARAAPRAGERVLDIGCGCGGTVLALARAVGPAGQVVGADVSEGMLGRAAARLRDAGLGRAALLRADASLPNFRPGSFDLAVSRFGVMFFRDPAGAFAALRAAMAPGGRLAFVCWQAQAENAFFTVPLEAVRGLLPPPEPPPSSPPAGEAPPPGPFALAEPERLRTVLDAAGWREISLLPHAADLPIAETGGAAAGARFATRIGAAASALAQAEAGDALREAAREAVRTALLPYERDGRVALGAKVWLVAAKAA